MPETKLKVENITKTFGDERAVDDISFEVKKGQLKSLLGPSGCGKSTTLRCIAGLESLDSGRIYIGDELVSDPAQNLQLPPKQRGIGMVFQSYAIWPHMTVRENVSFPLDYQRADLSKPEKEERVLDILESVGLDGYVDNLAAQLSGGQQQRVALSRALVVEPEILLMDEPLSSLDAKLRREMRIEIQDIYQEFDITVLYVTHAQDEAMFLSDEIAIMNDGRIVEEGTPTRLYSDPDTFFSMNFMGLTNNLKGSITELTDELATVETSIGDVKSSYRTERLQRGDSVDVCFRPKHCGLLLQPSDAGGAPAAVLQDARDTSGTDHPGSTFEGVIDSMGATKDFTEYEIELPGGNIQARTPEPLAVAIEDPITVFIPAEKVHLFRSEEISEAQLETVLNPTRAD